MLQGGRLATSSLLGGCAGPVMRKTSTLGFLTVTGAGRLKPSFKGKKLGLSWIVLTVTVLSTATGGTTGLFRASS